MEKIRQRLLIVDDEPINIKVLGSGLREKYVILVATNGAKAVEIAMSDPPPDLIMLDIMMPDMGGYEVCKQLKSDARTRDIPVIFISIKAEESDEMHGLKLGAVDYISKPFSMPLVLARVQTHMALKKTLQEAQDQQQQLHAVISHAMNGMIHINLKGIIHSFNPAAEAMFGYETGEVIGKNISILMPEPDKSQHDNYLQHYCNTNENRIIGTVRTVTALRKNGQTFPMELSVNAMFINGKKHFIGVVSDITDRTQAEDALRKLSSAIEQSGESVVITNRDGIIEYINPAFTSTTGYNSEEAIGQTPRLLKSDNQNAAFYEIMWKTITNGKVWRGKVINRRKDGSFYPTMLTISPITNQAGEIVYFVGTQADLSQLEDMENRFHQAQKMEAIGTMVGGIAHNFNNMLAGMIGNLYLAKKKVEAQPDVVRNLTNVEEISQHAGEMIQQLLAFARKGVVSMKEMPLTPFISETLKLLHASVPENIVVHQGLCADDLMIKGDATLLHQTLANLINNARDAVEGVDEPCITIRLEALDADDAFIGHHTYFKPGSYAHLSVADNGMGIPEYQIEHLFEPFFTTKEQGSGTGLGLAMVYGAVKTHHGFVEVDSEKGKGSSFHIYIPLLASKDIAAEPEQRQQAAQGRGELILLADDEPVVRAVMAEVLESLGYRVLQSKDGLEAMEAFEAHQQDISLALLDIVMPHCGGMPLAKRIRAVNPDVPVILLTGYDKDYALHGDGAIANYEVLTKPVNLNDLSHSIRKLLNKAVDSSLQ